MKVGVVGHGSIGSRHASNLAALGHEVLVYDPLNRKDVKFERNIYEQCEAIVIATPTQHHQSAVRACAERGKHMLVEKPISNTAHQLRELLDLAAKNHAIVMMGNNLRFHPCIKQAKQWIDEGEIDTPIWAHFTCAQLGQKYLSDGVILNTGAHEVDVALHLLGPAMVVSANVRLHPILGEEWVPISDDIVDFMLEHESGCRSTFHLDIVTPNEIREAWIVGNKERIGIEMRNRNISLGSRTVGHLGNYDDDYFDEMRAFMDCVQGKDAIGATGEDGLATLQVLLDVRKKAGLG